MTLACDTTVVVFTCMFIYILLALCSCSCSVHCINLIHVSIYGIASAVYSYLFIYYTLFCYITISWTRYCSWVFLTQMHPIFHHFWGWSIKNRLMAPLYIFSDGHTLASISTLVGLHFLYVDLNDFWHYRLASCSSSSSHKLGEMLAISMIDKYKIYYTDVWWCTLTM